MIISTEWIYIIMGIVCFFCSAYTFFDQANSRRIPSGLFYLIYAVTLLFGKVIPP
ncbi:DUF979 family protein, partial [Heyndrickxia coagulans]|nr:DUF979 family protein [Heyndrickxia coagulans]